MLVYVSVEAADSWGRGGGWRSKRSFMRARRARCRRRAFGRKWAGIALVTDAGADDCAYGGAR